MVACHNTTAPHWMIMGGRRLTPAPFLVAGIVNITPDSFSDGGRFATEAKASDRVQQVVDEGAHMVDLGAESTRPGAEDIGHAEEWRRLEPVLRAALALRAQTRQQAMQLERQQERAQTREQEPTPGTSHPSADFTVSIDTFRAATAGAALALSDSSGGGCVDIINDISGCSFEPEMVEVVASFKPGYVLGHSPARPDVMQHNPHYDNVVDDLLRYFTDRMNVLVRAGLPEACICLDPCIGFGKNLEHTLDIFAHLPRFAALGRPLYFGISRKSFLGRITGQPVDERGTLTQVAVALLAAKGVQIHRVHDVAATVATLKLVDSMANRE